jgi:thioredoxin 1
MAHTKIVTDHSFSSEVLEADKPVVVDFWAPWCGPCRQVSPILEEISKEYQDKISVVSVNTDENPQVTNRYGVTSLPTISVYCDGEVVKSIVGAKPKLLLLRELSEWIS